MHTAWFNEGGAAISDTTVPIISSDATVFDPVSGWPIVVPALNLVSITDAYSRSIPATTTIKYNISTQPGYVEGRIIENSASFPTYSGPFTIYGMLPQAALYDAIYMTARAFDSVTGPSQQTPEPYVFQTRVVNQPGGGGVLP
jgi:hypothetical protein